MWLSRFSGKERQCQHISGNIPSQRLSVLPQRWLYSVIPVKTGIQESVTEWNVTGWRRPLDYGPVSEYGVTFFRRNDGKPKHTDLARSR